MIWQDLVLAIGSWIFAIALIPTVLNKSKPALSTGIFTTVVLYVFVFTYMTLGFWLAAMSTFITGLLWNTITIQKFRQVKRSK